MSRSGRRARSDSGEEIHGRRRGGGSTEPWNNTSKHFAGGLPSSNEGGGTFRDGNCCRGRGVDEGSYLLRDFGTERFYFGSDVDCSCPGWMTSSGFWAEESPRVRSLVLHPSPSSHFPTPRAIQKVVHRPPELLRCHLQIITGTKRLPRRHLMPKRARKCILEGEESREFSPARERRGKDRL